ncbi:MAG: alpha/beta hydrolase, partial [Odoribacter sp.]|nr:alpha/beta hydrolase [Odoribacter sp.]
TKLEKGRTVNNVSPFLQNLFRPSVQPYLISWMKYDPVSEVSKLNIPILVIQGNMDIQLIMRDAELLASSNIRATRKIIKNMNHVLKEIDTKDKSQQQLIYLNPDLPIKQELVNIIVDFIFAENNLLLLP